MSTRYTFDPELNSCPLCNSKNIGFLYEISRTVPPFNVHKCTTCNFIFMNPPLSITSESELYNESYYTGSSDYHYYDERKFEKFARYVWDARLHTILKYKTKGNFLDVGCSFGGFLNAASRFFNVFGIERSSYSGNYAKKRIGNDVIHIGTLYNHPFKHNFFSVITLIEVLEHIRNPYEALMECYNLCQNDGLLIIQTANMEGMQAKIKKHNYGYFLPGHFSYFSKQNLLATLKKIGFKKIIVYQPVDFGLLPKLKKSMMNFNSLWDYSQWIRISLYHYISKFHFGNFSATSSMVIYAFK